MHLNKREFRIFQSGFKSVTRVERVGYVIRNDEYRFNKICHEKLLYAYFTGINHDDAVHKISK